jgi:Ribbon-helix-helix protein, copG family
MRRHTVAVRGVLRLMSGMAAGCPTRDARRAPFIARLEPQTVERLDAWAAAHDVSRSEAIRRLVELGLKAKK